MRVRKLAPGVYLNDKNEMEVDVPELLKRFLYEDTEENRDIVMEVAMQAFKKVFPDVPQRQTHQHECFKCYKRWEHEMPKADCAQPRFTYCQHCQN